MISELYHFSSLKVVRQIDFFGAYLLFFHLASHFVLVQYSFFQIKYGPKSLLKNGCKLFTTHYA